MTNLQEYQQGKNPTDYYNGVYTVLSILSGNDQTAASGKFTAYPLVVSVTDGATNAAKANAPVTFATTSGQLAVSPTGSGSSSLQVRADSNGMASVYLKMPVAGVFTQVTAAADNCPPVVFNEGLAQLLPTPTSISLSVDQGEVQERTLTLVNTSSQAISYSITPPSVSVPGTPTSEAPQDSANPEYNWADSNTAGGPAYVWNDISTTGTLLTNFQPSGDDGFQQISLPFGFPFYGNTFTSAYVGTNGYLTFGAGSTQYYHYALPGTNMPPNLIAPLFKDLNTTNSGHVYFQANAASLTVQFDSVPPFSGSGTYTFQIVLTNTGNITFYYKTMTGTVNDATVGIQNGNTSAPHGRQVAFNQAYITNGLAVQFYPIVPMAPWLQLRSYTGTVAAYDSASVDVTLNAVGLGASTYTATLHLNDSQGNTVGPDVPVNWTVSGIRVVDSDGNGLPDKWEMQYFGHLGVDPSADPDHDGLSNYLEYRLGSNPLAADTNGDGIIDGVAYRLGISVTNTDMNANGVSNAVERQQGVDPFRFSIPNSQQTVTTLNGGNTPLTITLLEPVNATLLP